MALRPLLFYTIAIACLPGLARAQVYHCTTANGATSYQDTSCPPDQHQQIVDVPATGPDAPLQPATASPPPPTSAPLPMVALPAAAPPLPTMYACRRYDSGKHYLSDTLPQPYFVPLGALGYPGESLARAYGPGGVGLSAPELARKPALNPHGPLIANAMVEVRDPCVYATPAQVCGELKQRLDANHEKLRMVFPSERAPYEQRERELQAQMQRC